MYLILFLFKNTQLAGHPLGSGPPLSDLVVNNLSSTTPSRSNFLRRSSLPTTRAWRGREANVTPLVMVIRGADEAGSRSEETRTRRTPTFATRPIVRRVESSKLLRAPC